MLIYRLRVGNRAHHGQVLYGFQINCGGVSVLYYRKIKKWGNNKTPLVSSVGVKGLYF